MHKKIKKICFFLKKNNATLKFKKLKKHQVTAPMIPLKKHNPYLKTT